MSDDAQSLSNDSETDDAQSQANASETDDAQSQANASDKTYDSLVDALERINWLRMDWEDDVFLQLSTCVLPDPFPSREHAQTQFDIDYARRETFAPSYMTDEAGVFYRLEITCRPVYLFHWQAGASCETWHVCLFQSRHQPVWQAIHDAASVAHLLSLPRKGPLATSSIEACSK